VACNKQQMGTGHRRRPAPAPSAQSEALSPAAQLRRRAGPAIGLGYYQLPGGAPGPLGAFWGGGARGRGGGSALALALITCCCCLCTVGCWLLAVGRWALDEQRASGLYKTKLSEVRGAQKLVVEI
jgi:hypothetical protein